VLAIAPGAAQLSHFGSFVMLNTNAGFAFLGESPHPHRNFIALLPSDGPGSYRVDPQIAATERSRTGSRLVETALALFKLIPVATSPLDQPP
jgi:hypothetical protein